MTLDANAMAQISRIDNRFISLSAVAATGDGNAFQFSKPVHWVSMQVSFTGGSPTVKCNLQGTIDGVNWFTMATFDTGAGSANGGIVSSVNHTVIGVRANLETLSGGTDPTVTAACVAS